MISFRPAGRLFIYAKNFNIAISLDTINMIYQTLHGDSAYRALPIHTTFIDFDCILRSQQCQTVLTENVMFLSI